MYVDLNLRVELCVAWHAFLRSALSWLLNVNLASRRMYQTFEMLRHQLYALDRSCQLNVPYISYQEFATLLCF